MLEIINNWLVSRDIDPFFADLLAKTITLALIIAVGLLADIIVKQVLLAGVRFSVLRTGTEWDDVMLKHGVFDRLAHLAPALVIQVLVPSMLDGDTRLVAFILGLVEVYMIVMSVLAIDAFLNGVFEIVRALDRVRGVPLKSFFQVVKIVVYSIGVLLVISILINRTPLYLISGLGAFTAVLMLIFKDPILGFVAGIQLTANNMVSRGDWIEMSKYEADGDVEEVALTTVKVRNWDQTITTIPTYALISESFRNWRGMMESGGRRITRSFNVDMNSIKFCDEEMLARFAKIQSIAEYLERKKAEVEAYNRQHRIDESSPINGRRLTNVGTFRAYVEAYLRNHPMINQDMTFLVRQLAPTENGLPIEIYVFCKEKAWAVYESVQADIFDHILASAPEFDLRVFQRPSGRDLHALIAGDGRVDTK